jgi:uncharacterized protein YjbI with pentapeptide repeats
MNPIDGTFAQRAHAILDLVDDRLDHMVIAAGLDPAVDLRYGNWRGFDLSDADLRGFNFTGADLTGARFDDAFIAGAIFDQTIYDPAMLREAADYEEFLRHANVRGFDKRALLKNHWLFNGLSSEHIDHLAACGVGKSVPRAASIWAKGDPRSSLIAICQLNLVTVQERRRRGQKSLTNLVRIVSSEWTAWIRIGGKKSTTTDMSSETKTKNRGFGGNWERHYRRYDPEDKRCGRA